MGAFSCKGKSLKIFAYTLLDKSYFFQNAGEKELQVPGQNKKNKSTNLGWKDRQKRSRREKGGGF